MNCFLSMPEFIKSANQVIRRSNFTDSLTADNRNRLRIFPKFSLCSDLRCSIVFDASALPKNYLLFMILFFIRPIRSQCRLLLKLSRHLNDEMLRVCRIIVAGQLKVSPFITAPITPREYLKTFDLFQFMDQR